MRILQVNARHARVGGTEVYVHQILAALRERGHAVALFAQEPEEERDEPELRVLRRPDYDAEHLVHHEALGESLCSFARAFRPDVLHVHNLHTFPATLPRVIAELGLPVLLHPHEFGLLCPNAWCTWADGTPCPGGAGRKCFEHDCTKNSPYEPRHVLVSRLRLLGTRRMADAVVCGSDALADRMRANGYPDVRTLRYFADPDKFGGLDALARLRASIPRARDEILYLGRLATEKGVGTLLQAMPLVLRERPGTRLAITGGGPLRAELERESRALGLGDAVRFTGPVPHDQVPALLARAAAQILPSVWAENAAQSCYDCLMLGLPLIASRVAALPEIVRDEVNGLLFTPRDPADLARQIVRVLADEALARRLSEGCASELGRYDKRTHLAALEQLYSGLRARPAESRIDGDPELEAVVESYDRMLVQRRLVARSGRLRKWMNRALDLFES